MSPILPPELVDQVNSGMAKSGTDFYAFLAVVLILGVVGLILWFQHKTAVARANAPTPQPTNKPNTLEDLLSDENAAARIIRVLSLLEHRMGSLEDAGRKNREEMRKDLKEIRAEFAQGLSSIHRRIDEHLQAGHPGAAG